MRAPQPERNFSPDQAAAKSETFREQLERLEQQDQAKQALRDKGYGCTGMDIIRTVELVPSDGDHPLSGGNP